MIVTEAEIREEAIKRIKILIDRFNLNEKVLKYFQEGKVYYSYLTANGCIGSIDAISYDKSYEQAVKQFEEKYPGCIVYHAIETITQHGKLLSLLYVSNDKDGWENQNLENNYIFSYVVNMNDPDLSEFGDITIGRFSKSGALIRTDI